MASSEKKRADELRKAQDKARSLFNDIVEQGLIVAGRTEKQVERAIFEIAKSKYGVEKHWHKRVIRAGANSMTVYRENPPNLTIQEDDIVYVDLGPVFDSREADFGRTFVVGSNPEKIRLRDTLPKFFAKGRAYFEANDGLTGAELFAFMTKQATDEGWIFAGEIAGHIVGEFPHARIPGEKTSFLIAPENPGRLRDLDARGNVRHWILEVHLADSTRSFGGFYEELITV